MATIPDQKRSRDELQEMRRRNAFSVRPPVQQLQAQAVSKVFLGVCYTLAILSALALVFSKSVGDMVYSGMTSLGVSLSGYSDEVVMAWVHGGCVTVAGVAMLFSFWIFWKKPRSHHHAAILFMISLLVIVFGVLYFTNRSV